MIDVLETVSTHCSHCLFFLISMYVVPFSWYYLNARSYSIQLFRQKKKVHATYFVAWWPAEMLISSTPSASPPLYLSTVYIFICHHINQDEKYSYMLYFMIYIFVCPPINQVSVIAHRKSKICLHAPTTHAQFTNPFRTHFCTHIACAEVRFYAHVRRKATSAFYLSSANN